MKIFSRAEVLKHNKKSDCWIIVQNNVYDISAFIASHPGGSEILLARAGEDATSYFIAKHATNKEVIKRLETMKIGCLPIAEQITANDFDESFLMELIDRCYKDKLYHISELQQVKYFFLRTGSVLLFFCLSFFVLYTSSEWYWKIPAVIIQAIIATSLFGFIAHENTHRNYPKNFLPKILLRISWPVFWPFISQNPLRYEHNSHHVKIGDPEFDYEVAAFAPLMRYSAQVKHQSFHRYQHKLARFMYPFYANIITTVGGITSGFWTMHNRKVGVEHSLSVVATLVYFIAVPAFFSSSIVEWVLLYLLYQCVLFYGIYVGAAINHFVPASATPIPESHSNQYGYYICRNTTNFCAESNFWFWYTGGFNVQIEHHLIPFIPVENLRKMIPIVKTLCAKYGYPYYNYPSFLKLWNDHYSYLFNLSEVNHSAVQIAEVANKAGYQAR